MTAIIQTMLLLLAVPVAMALLAQQLKLAPSILLVLAGIALTVVPGLPRMELAPELVLLVLLVPRSAAAPTATCGGGKIPTAAPEEFRRSGSGPRE